MDDDGLHIRSRVWLVFAVAAVATLAVVSLIVGQIEHGAQHDREQEHEEIVDRLLDAQTERRREHEEILDQHEEALERCPAS